MQTLGQQIRAAREAAGMSQLQLAIACGWGHTNQSAIENDRETIGRARLERLSVELECEFVISSGGVRFVQPAAAQAETPEGE